MRAFCHDHAGLQHGKGPDGHACAELRRRVNHGAGVDRVIVLDPIRRLKPGPPPLRQAREMR